jgi:HTH-type transcriptional regulator / antitoxin HigA
VEAPLPDLYFQLIRQLPLRPIRSDEELDRAIAMINTLLDRNDLDPTEEDYLEVLSDLVERYETATHPMGPVSAADVLQHLLEAREVTPTEVARRTGIAGSALANLLAGKRSPSRSQVAKLAHYFHVDPATFSPED